MTEPLAEITDFSQERDYDSLVGRHSELQEEIKELQSELETTLISESELDDAQIERIRDTYIDIVQSDLQSLLKGDYKLEEFCSAVNDVVDDIEEVLHNPKAETVVEEIDGWIVSTGLEPLSDDEKQGLRQAIISDVETSKAAVNQAKAAHGALRGHLGPLQEKVDQLLRSELINVHAPSDLADIRDSLQSFERGWHGDWILDHDLDVGKELNEQIWSVLLEDLKGDMEDRGSLNQAAVLVDNRSERIKRTLSDINETWADIEAEYRRLPDDVSYDEASLLMLLEEQLREDLSLSTYRSAFKTLQEGLEKLIEIQNSDLEEFRSDREPEIEGLQDPLEGIHGSLEDATEIQSQALKADSVKEIERLKEEELCDYIGEAKDERKELRSRLKEKVKTARRLSEKFDITTEEDLTDLYTETVDQNDVDRLLELSNRCATVLNEIRSRIREELPEAQAQLLEDLLTLSTDNSDLTLSMIESELDYSDEESLFEGLLGLRENELLEMEISIN
jgi:hypothetical protein